MSWTTDWIRSLDSQVRVVLPDGSIAEGHCIDVSYESDFPAMRILFDADVVSHADSGIEGRDFWVHPRYVWPNEGR